MYATCFAEEKDGSGLNLHVFQEPKLLSPKSIYIQTNNLICENKFKPPLKSINSKHKSAEGIKNNKSIKS